MNGKSLGVIIAVVLIMGAGVFLIKDRILNTTPSPASPTPEVATTTPVPIATEVSSTVSQEDIVTLTADGFSPLSLTVKAGTKVTFVNKSSANATVDSAPHPVHTSFPALNLGAFKDGETLTFIFDKMGTYGYHNHLNATQKGTIVVQ